MFSSSPAYGVPLQPEAHRQADALRQQRHLAVYFMFHWGPLNPIETFIGTL